MHMFYIYTTLCLFCFICSIYIISLLLLILLAYYYYYSAIYCITQAQPKLSLAIYKNGLVVSKKIPNQEQKRNCILPSIK